MTLTYRRASMDDAVSLAPRLRPADAEEVRLSCGDDIEGALIQSVCDSDVAEAVVLEGRVICLRGITDGGAGVGVPWLLGSPEVTRFTKHLVGGAKRWVLDMEQKYPLLINMVHAENALAIKWLQHIGFTLGPLFPEWGVGKAPFYQFYRYKQ